MDAPTRAQLFDLGASEVAARSAARPPGYRVDPEQCFVEGSDLNIVVASSSAMAEEAIRQLVIRAKILLLDGAEGEDLDRLVADRFSPTIVRKQASPSVGPVTLTRISGGFPAFTLPTGSLVKTNNGIEFETATSVSLASGFGGPASVNVQARTAGIQGDVAIGAINAFVVAPSDPNVRVTNLEPTAGGDVRESDARLRARARDFFRTARRGTIAAIEFGALTVSGIRQATAVEEVNALGEPTGRVALYIADALGQANVTLVSAVRSAEIEYRAAGVVLDISGAIPTYVSIRYQLEFVAGVDSTNLASLVRSATIAAVNALAPNQPLRVSQLFAVARSVKGVVVPEDAIVEPVGDLIPLAGQVIRTRADLVSFV